MLYGQFYFGPWWDQLKHSKVCFQGIMLVMELGFNYVEVLDIL